MYCSQCGKKIDKQAKFCKFCGHKVTKIETIDTKSLFERLERDWDSRILPTLRNKEIMEKIGDAHGQDYDKIKKVVGEKDFLQWTQATLFDPRQENVVFETEEAAKEAGRRADLINQLDFAYEVENGKKLPASNKNRVLHFVSDRFLAQMYGTKFNKFGLEYIYLNYPPEKVEEVIKNIRPDVIIMDVIMPHMDGFTATERIKKDNKIKDIPLVFLTNLSQPEDIKKGMDLGAADYLVSANFMPQDILNKIKGILGIPIEEKPEVIPRPAESASHHPSFFDLPMDKEKENADVIEPEVSRERSSSDIRSKMFKYLGKYWWILLILIVTIFLISGVSIWTLLLYAAGVVVVLLFFLPLIFHFISPVFVLIAGLVDHYKESKGQSFGKRYIFIPATILAASGFFGAQMILSSWVTIMSVLIWASVVGFFITFFAMFFFGLAPFAIILAPFVVWIQSGFIEFVGIGVFFLMTLFWFGFSGMAFSDRFHQSPEDFLGYSPHIFLLGALSFQVIALPFYHFELSGAGDIISDFGGAIFLLLALIAAFKWRTIKKKIPREKTEEIFKPSVWVYILGVIFTAILLFTFDVNYGAPTAVLFWLLSFFVITLIGRFFGIFKKVGKSRKAEIREMSEILQEAEEKFGVNFKLVSEQIEQAMRKDTEQFLKIVHQGRSVRKYVYSMIANTSGDMIESGQYHIYRGVISPMDPGKDLVSIFDGAMDELVRLGDTDKNNAEEQKKALRENIKNIG